MVEDDENHTYPMNLYHYFPIILNLYGEDCFTRQFVLKFHNIYLVFVWAQSDETRKLFFSYLQVVWNERLNVYLQVIQCVC